MPPISFIVLILAEAVLIFGYVRLWRWLWPEDWL